MFGTHAFSTAESGAPVVAWSPDRATARSPPPDRHEGDRQTVDARRATGDNGPRNEHSSHRHRGLKGLYEAGEAKGVPASLVPKIRDMLLAIDEAAEVREVALFPGWKLHPLKGDLKGFWSLTVTGNLRIVFRFEKGDAFEVDLIDYH